MVSMRDRQRSELLQTISDRNEVIARASAERDEAIRQCGLLDALDLLEGAAFHGRPASGEVDKSKLDEVAPSAGSTSQGRLPRTTSDGDSEPEFRPSLVDSEIFERFLRKLDSRYRRAVLLMMEILEREHPNEVRVRTIDESIADLKLCPNPTFSKIKGAMRKASLIQYNSSARTYSLPCVESNFLDPID